MFKTYIHTQSSQKLPMNPLQFSTLIWFHTRTFLQTLKGIKKSIHFSTKKRLQSLELLQSSEWNLSQKILEWYRTASGRLMLILHHTCEYTWSKIANLSVQFDFNWKYVKLIIECFFLVFNAHVKKASIATKNVQFFGNYSTSYLPSIYM